LQQQVWIDYVQRMVTQRGDSKRFSLQQMYARLGWLARQMRAHNMTVFYLEHMQPDWLEVRKKRIYTLLAVLIPGILIGILVSLLVRLFLGISDTLPLFQQCLLGGFLGGVFSNTGRAEGIVQVLDRTQFHHGPLFTHLSSGRTSLTPTLAAKRANHSYLRELRR
jgi:hypothetical protein